MRKLYFLGGLLSNYRTLLAEAVTVGREHGFDVTILDVVNLVPRWQAHPNPWEQLDLAPLVTTLHEEAELESFCEEHRRKSNRRKNSGRDRSDLVVFLNLPNRELRWIWRMLARSGFSVGAMTLNPVPQIIDQPLARHLLGRLVTQPLLWLKSLIKPVPDFWIVSGAKTVNNFQTFFRHHRSTRMITTHSTDYENFRRCAANHSGSREEKIILFLDQGWHAKLRAGFRPDGRYPPTREETYRRAVVPWLSSLARESGLAVVVSAHPKAAVERVRETYPGLEVSTRSSAELVQQAHCVIGNCTTSLQYAVMAKRPVILFTSDELDRSIMHSGLRGYESVLGAPVVNIDHPPPADRLLATLTVDRERYRRFLKNYVVQTESVQGGLWEKVFRQLAEPA
jgi:hypothetical protein